jgi:hypothetical protein
LSVCVVRKADAACLGDSFEARDDIDAVAEDIIIIDNDVANVNADAEFNLDVLRHVDIVRS